jgi:uncharacterized protein (DUF433 family)
MDVDDEEDEILLNRITRNPQIYGGKPIIRGHRLAVEHVLGMMIGGSAPQDILDHYDWLEIEDVQACLLYAQRLVEKEHHESRVAAAK